MATFDPNAIPGAVANRVLDREAWARQRLTEHAGRSFVIAVGPAASAFVIDDAGRVASTSPAHVTADLRLSISPLDLPAFLADPARWDRYVRAEGDPALHATIKALAPTLPWFVEQAFAGVLGNAMGQQVAETGRRLLALPEYAAERVGASVTSFAHERSGLLTTGDEGRTFAEQVAALAATVDALGARIEALADRLPPQSMLRVIAKPRRSPPDPRDR